MSGLIVPQKLKLYSETFIHHFEVNLITIILYLRQSLEFVGCPTIKKTFTVGHNSVPTPSGALKSAVNRLTNIANLLNAVKKTKKENTEYASEWIADLDRYQSNSLEIRKILLNVGLDIFRSFEEFFLSDKIDNDTIIEFAINSAEMIIKYFASPIYGNNVKFNEKNILQGILIVAGFSEPSDVSLDQQNIIECCYGKIYSTLFKTTGDNNRRKSLLAKHICNSAILLQNNNLYIKKSKPSTEIIRHSFILIEENIEIITNHFELKQYPNVYNCKIQINDNFLNILYEELYKNESKAQQCIIEKIEGIKTNLLKDTKKIKELYNLEVIEELINSIECFESSLEKIEDESNDSDEEKRVENGVHVKTTNIAKNTIKHWKMYN